MQRSTLLTVTSLLSILLFTVHVADDIVRGFERGGPWNLSAIVIFVTWSYATLLLAGRRSGHLIILLASLLSLCAPFLHFQGAGGVAGGAIAKSSGALIWVWTLLALGVTAAFSVVLATQELWRTRRRSAAEAR